MPRAAVTTSVFTLLLASVLPAAALAPKDVVIVANKSVPASRDVAAHYLAKRKVPAENLIELDLPTGEDISRADYDAKLAGPLREKLAGRKQDVKVLLTVYGVPLRVGPQSPTQADEAQLAILRPLLDESRKEVERLEKENPQDKTKLEAARKARDARAGKEQSLHHAESTASVDSELMLLWHPPYPLERWQPNPLNWRFPADERAKLPPTLMTARVDGPTPAIAKRLIDDAIEVEEAGGLTGKAYVDARGIGYDPKNATDGGIGYAGYDESFRETAALLREAGMAVVLDDKNDLFKPDSCPDAALYTGWYSLANYVPCCQFTKGAVAWHLASSEAVSLRDGKSKLWCPNLLKAGVAATLGPVGEPYTIGFPKPAEFFGFLATGKYTLVECYARTVLVTSWMTVLVGDPLYTPFAKHPLLKEDAVKASPKSAPAMFR
ncbi:TIGR03790 family protein [Fimbriiglobus ruber]|uniref:TIGR03790 family protein n=1 Tax=Fimbriiglobus ruber TaxID=1908690 RepID=A0A225DLP2_9BACT|nr:TIGR03790 family protein [Fimbriiglobus ruber]OWK42302.1 hypothetical protein FRUB_04380 [Fimbriiglobus ruber]